MKNTLLLLFLAGFFVSHSTFAESELTEKSNNPHYYIKLAEEFEQSDVEYAKLALFSAFNLLQDNPNKTLELQVLLKQASIAKEQEYYETSQKFLDKAKVVRNSINENNQTFDLKQLFTEVKIFHLEAEIKGAQKKYDEAILILDKTLTLIEQSGGNPTLLQSTFSIKGDLYSAAKKYRLAITSYLLSQHHVSAQPNEIKIMLWSEIAFIYTRLNDNYSAIKYFNRVLGLLIRENNLPEQAKVLLNISRSYKKVSAYKEALLFGNKALKVAKDTINEEFTLKSLLHLSIIYRRLSSYDNALEYGLEALNIYQKNNDLNGIVSSLNAIGLIYNRLGQRDKAKSYFEHVLNFPQNKIQQKYYAAALRELAFYNYYQKSYALALELSEQAYQIYEQINDLKGKGTVKKNLGLIYQATGNVNQAFEAFTFGIETAKKTGDMWEQADNLAHISLLYAEKEPKKTHFWANKSLKLSQKIHAKPIIEKVYSALTLAEENMQNFKQALFYARLQAKSVNEIKREEINRHAAEMHVLQNVINKVYELDLLKQKNSTMVDTLQKQKNQLTTLQMSSESDKIFIHNLKIVIFILIISLLIITAFYRKTKKGSSKSINAS